MTNDKDSTPALIAGAMFPPLVAAFLAVYQIWDGWVLSIMWRWFAVPIFKLPSLSISMAIGVTLIFGLLTHQYNLDPKETAKGQKAMRFFRPFLNGGLTLLIGYIVKP